MSANTPARLPTPSRVPISGTGPQKGFTLLELMVAISIFSILGLGAYRLLSGEILAQEKLQAHNRELHQWQRGLRKLQQDLLQISARPIRTAYDDQAPALEGQRDQLTFTRAGWPNPRSETRSQLQRVRYRLGRAPQTGVGTPTSDRPQLLREYWQVLDQAQDSEPQTQRLLDDISQLEIRYLDAKGNWHTQWPPLDYSIAPDTTSNRLPAAIELQLTSPRQGTVTRLIALRDRVNPGSDPNA